MLSLSLTVLISLASLLLAPDTVQIAFVGDAMQHESQLKAAKQHDGSYDYTNCFSAIKPYVESADYAVVNLETPLGGGPRYSGYPTFSAPDSYAEALIDAGFDLFLTANNHTLDRRDRGLIRTINALDSLGVEHIGTYRNADHRRKATPLISDIKGFKVAFLNYTYGTNGITIQGDVVVNHIDINDIEADIASARRNGAEIVTVCIHWGDEYKLLPNATQKSLAKRIFEADADMIIGSHPHVIQPMELTRDADRNRLLVYSLGNFISGMRTTDTRGGAMVNVKLTRDDNGKAIITDASYRLVFTRSPQSGNRNYRLVPAESDLDGVAKTQRDAFVRNAENIFKKHNINVNRDSSNHMKLSTIPPIKSKLELSK